MIFVSLDNSDSEKLDNSDSEPRRTTRGKERRTRRRSRSKSVMRERSLASAPGEEPFDDLTVELSDRKLQGLSDDMKDKLREIGRVDPTQYKIEHFK